ncbi:MAG: T9SS C-terminal target domain-containing protein [Ignavibacteriales bacterium]|nr:MAG: T9SS C-terminal target domain-containing protein [Ignavibacteriales bacterium]
MATILNFSLTSFNWVEELSLIRGEYNSVAFCNPGLGLAVGDNGLIASFSNDSEINLDITINPNPKNFYLQNYPNPFNPATTISYQLPVNGYVVLKVYNALGSEVATLVDEEKPAGIYTANFNASQLPSGVYFYKLETGSMVETKKMILLR